MYPRLKYLTENRLNFNKYLEKSMSEVVGHLRVALSVQSVYRGTIYPCTSLSPEGSSIEYKEKALNCGLFDRQQSTDRVDQSTGTIGDDIRGGISAKFLF